MIEEVFSHRRIQLGILGMIETNNEYTLGIGAYLLTTYNIIRYTYLQSSVPKVGVSIFLYLLRRASISHICTYYILR